MVLYVVLLFLLSLFSVLQETMAGNALPENTQFPGKQDPGIILGPSVTGGWFTKNAGQIENHEIRFVYPASGCSIGFVESGYVIRLSGEDDRTDVVKVNFESSNRVAPMGRKRLSHSSNYFMGNDPPGWRTTVPNYGRLVYEELYQGIDLVFYTTGDGVKYDFLVSPGADPRDISCRYQGADSLSKGSSGQLHVSIPGSILVEEAPFAYQVMDGKTMEVPARWVVEENMVRYGLGSFDPSYELVIDPLIYSAFVGGSGEESSPDIVLDQGNNAYVMGHTTSLDFPTTTGCLDSSSNGDNDVFVFKLSADGSRLLYSTYVGGSGSDIAVGIVIDDDNNAYVTGHTDSSDFPTTTGSFDMLHNGEVDAFVFKLDDQGSELVYSTFVGGDDYDEAHDISLDPENNAYVTGYTSSSDFPTTPGAYDNTYNGFWDVFCFKLAPGGSYLSYSTFIGGEDHDVGYDIVLDPGNNAYIAGRTRSGDFPTTTGCFDDSYNGGFCDICVVKLDADGSELLYSTYMGGSDYDRAEDLVLGRGETAWVTGSTNSTNFPVTSDCFSCSKTGDTRDIYVFELGQGGDELLYSSYVGGQGYDAAAGITLDPGGRVYVTGRTSSEDFPTSPGCFNSSFGGWNDVVVFSLDPGEEELAYSSFVGAGTPGGIVLDPENNVYVAGSSWSSSYFPTTPGSYDESPNGETDIVVFALDTAPERPVAHIGSISPSPALTSDRVGFQGQGEGAGDIVRYVWRSDMDGELYNGTEAWFEHAGLSLGWHEISFMVRDEEGSWSREARERLLIHTRPVARIDTISPDPALLGEELLLDGTGTDDGVVVSYRWRSSIDEVIFHGPEHWLVCSNLSTGRHSIGLEVMDDQGVWSWEVTRTLIVHERPRAEIVSISPDPACESDEVSFQGNAEDDGIVTLYVWTSSLDGELYNDSGDEFDIGYLSAGVHTITLRVQDNHGAWSEELSASLTITACAPSNRPPTVIITSPGNGDRVKGKISCRGTAYDEDGIVETVEISMNGGPWHPATGTTSWVFEWDTNEVQNGEYTIMARSFDGQDHSREETIVVSVLQPVT